MRKSILLLIVLALLLSAAVPALAAGREVRILSTEDFLAFAENCRLDSYSRDLTVVLCATVDLTGTDFAPIASFSGTLEGNGHTIQGLSVTDAGSGQGLFRYLTETAVIRNLHVHGTVTPEGSASQVGGIAGSNAGRLENCSFTGQVSGTDYVGGIVGSNALSGIIENCRMDGNIHGTHFVGGITGENLGVIRGCSNSSLVNTTAEQNTVALEDISLESLLDTESAATVTDIGGIAGTTGGVIRDCENTGAVGYPQIGYNIGGIAGSTSGYITGCTNRGTVEGRKEVGGIAGQLKPAVYMAFEEDALQALQQQMDTMSAVTSQASGQLQAGANTLGGQFNHLKEQLGIAQDALDSLVPDRDDPTLPDLDAIQAAQNALSSSMSSLSGTLSSMGSSAESMLSAGHQSIQSISQQMQAIGGILSKAEENLGGTVADVSDLDTEADTTGKIENCKNLAQIRGDWNIGGITGAVSFENTMDPEEDLQFNGAISANFDCQFRAVVLGCENTGAVAGKKQHAGGICGWMTMGLLKNCTSTGTMLNADADYVGGICGRSMGYIRSCMARCALSGDTWVGGIAGSGSTVSQCYAMVALEDYTEKAGAILGHTEADPALERNYYLPIGRDIGAVDGINYDTQAQSMPAIDFLRLKEIPDSFRQVTVRFLFEDGTVHTILVPFAGHLTERQIPAIPPKDGCEGTWLGDIQPIAPLFFDVDFTVGYESRLFTLESKQTGRGGLPVLLVQGSFLPDTVFSMRPLDSQSLDAWSLNLPKAQENLTLRYLLPEGLEPDAVLLNIQSADGSWQEVPFSVNGSYLVFSVPGDIQAMALEHAPADYTGYLLAGAGALALILLVAAVLTVKAVRKKAKK